VGQGVPLFFERDRPLGIAAGDQSFNYRTKTSGDLSLRQAEVGQPHHFILTHRNSARDLGQIFTEPDTDQQFLEFAERSFSGQPPCIGCELADSLDAQRKSLFAYLEGLSDAELGRKARIPLFKDFMGTDEIPIPMFVGAMFDYHWNDHAGHIAKIRKAAGLPEAK